MSIYRIHQNIEDFMFFTIDDLDVYDKMEDFDIDGFGRPLQFNWSAPNSEFTPSDSGSTIIPDITQWSGSDLIFSDTAKTTLNKLLADLGEYYPLSGKNKNYCLFNPTDRMAHEIIDLEQTKSAYFDDGSWHKLEVLRFNEKAETLAPALFTLEIDSGTSLYCTDEFKLAVETSKLKGLVFESIR